MNRLFSPFRHISVIAIVVASIALAGCSSSKRVAEATVSTPAAGNATQVDAKKALTKIYQARLTEQNLTADLNLTVAYGDNDISAPGSLHMRRDEMIRLQVFVPLLGTEVGRVEFTPTKVTIIDRLHKQYVQCSYDEVDFLADNGLTFYNLQSLFWNQVFMPGQNNIDLTALQRFATSTDAQGSMINLSLDRGNIGYKWAAQSADGLVRKANISYSGTGNKATMNWVYDKFKALGSKQYPSLQTISIDLKANNKTRKASLTLKLSSIDNSSKWNTTTEISKKYKKVTASEALKKLFGK